MISSKILLFGFGWGNASDSVASAIKLIDVCLFRKLLGSSHRHSYGPKIPRIFILCFQSFYNPIFHLFYAIFPKYPKFLSFKICPWSPDDVWDVRHLRRLQLKMPAPHSTSLRCPYMTVTDNWNRFSFRYTVGLAMLCISSWIWQIHYT